MKTELNLTHRRMAMIVYPGCVMLDACGPMEVFSFANISLQMYGQLSIKESVYSMCFISAQKGPVRTSAGVSILADYEGWPGSM